MTETPERQLPKPAALSIADAATVLSKTSGQPIDAEMIEEVLRQCVGDTYNTVSGH